MITSKLHVLMTRFSLASLIVLSSLSLSSCQDEDFGFTKEEISDAVYDRNFIAKYGEIDPNQSWDLSKYAVKKSLSTRALSNGCDFYEDYTNSGLKDVISLDVENQWYYVDPSLISAFNSNLGEGLDNTGQGDFNFEFTSTGAPFYIVPLFQGISGLECDLHMEVNYDGKHFDKQIWTKGLNLEKQEYGSIEWQPLQENYDVYGDYHNKSEYEALYKGSTMGAESTRSKPIRCIVPAGATIKFYLHITKGRLRSNATTNGAEHTDADLAFTHVRQYSDQKKMILLDENKFQTPQTAKDRFGEHAMIIGCEDASYGNEKVTVYRKDNDGTISHTDLTSSNNYSFEGVTVNDGWGGDNDMNDLVFMFISDDLPVKDEANVIKKRYLFEDLGSVSDWDFNDVVVDLYSKTDHNGDIVEQRAYMRHKCGTTNFEINVGSALNVFGTHAGEVQNQNFTMPETEYGSTITKKVWTSTVNGSWPWDPTTNNVSIKVYPGTNNIKGDENMDTSNSVSTNATDPTAQQMASREYGFPRFGEIPRIIAVDIDFPWTDENQDIPQSLFTFVNISANAALDNEGHETGVVSGAGTYRLDEKVTLKAIANPGYEFYHWDRDENNKSNPREITVSQSTTYTAVFRKKDSVDPKNYDFTVIIDGPGDLNAWNANKHLTSYQYSIPTVVKGDDGMLRPNEDGFWMKAVPDDGKIFSHWSDQNGNIQKTDVIWVKSAGTYTAHFVEPKTLTIQVAKQDWDAMTADEKNKFELYLKDGSNVEKLTVTNGVATKTVSSDEVQVIANIQGRDGRDVKYQWSEGVHTDDSNTFETWDVAKNSESDIESSFDDKWGSKKSISVPSDGCKIVTIGVTYQVLAFESLRVNNTDGELVNDDPYGTINIHNENKRQVYLHKNTTFSLVATPKAGYRFYGWKDFGSDPVLRGQTNPNGERYFTAIFTENTRRTLTFDFGTNSDIYSVTVNGETKQVNGSQTISFNVPEGAAVNAKFIHNNETKTDWNYRYDMSQNGNALQNKFAFEEFTLFNSMPSSATTINVETMYQVVAWVKDGQSSMGSVSFTCNGTNVSGNSTYAPKGASLVFTATPNSGYAFDKWEYNDPSTVTVSGPTFRTAIFKQAPQQSAVTVKVNINAAGTVQINGGTASTSVSGNYDKNVELTLTASRGNTGYAFEQWLWNHASTYERKLTPTNDSHEVIAKYIAGSEIFDSPTIVKDQWSGLDIWNSNYWTAFRNFINGKNSVTLRIYCTDGSTGTFRISKRFSKEWVEMNNGSSFDITSTTEEDGMKSVRVTLNSSQINELYNSNGLVIQQTSATHDTGATFNRIIVTAN